MGNVMLNKCLDGIVNGKSYRFERVLQYRESRGT